MAGISALIPMPIVTPRLELRPLQPGDGTLLLEYKRESWSELLKWMIWVHPPSIETRSVADDEAFCAFKHDKFLRREDITVLAFSRADGRLIGHGGLHNCNWQIPMFSLGFGVRSRETGKGYATEIATALTRYAFDALGAQKVATLHAAGNIGSQRVIEKTGFEKEGVLRHQHVLPSGIVDEHHYGLLSPKPLPDLDVSWG